MKKRLLSMLLCIALLASMFAGCSSGAPSEEPKAPVDTKEDTAVVPDEKEDEFAWLHPASLPLVEEGTEKTLRIWSQIQPDGGEVEDLFIVKFIEEYMNINVEITTFTTENKSEMISLGFAGDDLPDIIIQGGFSTSDLMTYGASEGQLLDIAPYLNEKYMPNLSKIYELYPQYRSTVEDTEGHIWSLGYISDPTGRKAVARGFVNYDRCYEYGLEIPETLDEFVDMLYKFKEEEPESYPLGGCWAYKSPSNYLLNAYGYITPDFHGTTMAMRNGTPVLPCADREVFGEYLTLMNKFYEDGIIHPDYFTLDKAGEKAVLADGLAAFVCDSIHFYCPDAVPQFWSALPLTSEYKDSATWPIGTAIATSFGQAVITAQCKEPELAAAFLDFFYDAQMYHLAVVGPTVEDTQWHMENVNGYSLDEVGGRVYQDYLDNKDLYGSATLYGYKHLQLWDARTFGTECTMDDFANGITYAGTPDWESLADPSEMRTMDVDPNTLYQIALESTICTYPMDECFPHAVWVDAETSVELGNTLKLIQEYATKEIAKFITGARPLDELDAYFDEIDRLGAAEYVEFMTEYYNSTK